ncbi:MAG: NAD(P)-dependent alcohol dehydrogenase [Flavobacterium sp.]
MKAIVINRYGTPEVLKLKDVKQPKPNKDEILVKISATAVNSGDIRIRKADPFAVRLFFGLFKPKTAILGSVFSGVIESVGTNVKKFKIGDEVFGHTNIAFGTYAAYKCLDENNSIAIKPDSVSHTQAAVIPFGGVTALYFLKRAFIQPGQKVLIFGASGSVGSSAVQLAKHFGAIVTGVCSTANVAMVTSLGADKVIDYTKEDFIKNGDKYDIIFDTVNKIPILNSLQSLNLQGTLILSAAGFLEIMYGACLSVCRIKKIKIITGVTKHTADDMIFLKKLIESGELKPLIDKTYPLEKMAEAHAYVEKGHKKGNVAIKV